MQSYDREWARDLSDNPSSIGLGAYINNGRRYEKVSVEVLRSRWAEALRRWLDNQSDSNSTMLEYLTGELNARGLDLPTELVPAEMKQLRAQVDLEDGEFD